MPGSWRTTAWRTLTRPSSPGCRRATSCGGETSAAAQPEHAPLAIKTAGIACVIAASFARIFYRNAINIGLPILECPSASTAIREGNTVSVNFDTGVITDETTGETFQAEPFPPFIQKIIRSGGLMASIQAR